MDEISDERVIGASIDVVWAATIDLPRLPSITPTISEVELLGDGPVRIGLPVRVRQPLQRSRTWVVETVDAPGPGGPGRFAWSTTLAGVRMTAIHDLAPIGEDRTGHTLRVQLRGRGAGVLTGLLRLPVQRALRQENAGFAEHCEQAG